MKPGKDRVAAANSPTQKSRVARAHTIPVLAGFSAIVLLAGCAVGPRYSKPATPVPPAFKEQPPVGWKQAHPADQLLRGKWWEIFQDPQLNTLEERIQLSNQTLKTAQAQFAQARALVRYNRAGYYPTVTAGLSATENKLSHNRSFVPSKTSYPDYLLPLDASYEVDVWGRVRHTVEAARENAQASAADLESISLSLHAELAMDYFQMRGFDAEEDILDANVAAFEKALQLTQNRHAGGIASSVDVSQAQAQLDATRAQAVDLGIQRQQYEHAIAVLVGEPPAQLNLAHAPLVTAPPKIPVGLPSDLLERRPDIAAGERRMAAANAQIGVARAAYFPIIGLSANGGFESTAITTLLQGPSGFVAIGASAAGTLFDAGRRRALNEQARAAYDQTVANYRQTVLTAFQDVEDNLVALRVLEDEAKTQDAAVAAAEQSLQLSTNRYKGGVVSYLEVITAQTTALADQRAAVDILRRRMAATVLLIKALGGGWNASTLPTMSAARPPLAKGQ